MEIAIASFKEGTSTVRLNMIFERTELVITELEKSTYIKETPALLPVKEIESTKPGKVVYVEKLLFKKKGR